MTYFQAIDNHNTVIEMIPEGQSPQSLEAAAQAWNQNFNADYSNFSEADMSEELSRQEKERLYLVYGYEE